MSQTTRLRLKGIITCSFGRSEATNLALYRKTATFPGELRGGEAFMFISKGLNQVLFIFKSIELKVEKGHGKPGGGSTRGVIDSRRLRLDGGTWHPYMIQDYANAVGINLVGIRRLEDILEDRRSEMRRPREE